MAEKPIIGFVNSIVEAPSPSPSASTPTSTSPQAIGTEGPPAPRRSIVRFRIAEDADPADSEALIDPESTMAARNTRLLQGLMRLGAPAYVERTPNRVISNVLTPTIGRVVAIHEPGEDDEDGPLRVQLDNSSASHFITRSSATEQSIALLRASMEAGDVLLVTQDRQKTAIVDVRPCPKEWIQSAPKPEPMVEPPESAGKTLIETLTPKTPEEIAELFRAVQQLTCPTDNSQFGCLPFLFALDGCRARAHRMCDLLKSDHAVEAAKVWVFATSKASLTPKTNSLEQCHARWEVHVAPVVRVAGTDALMVIDPSIFDEPVTRAAFFAAMNNPQASEALTPRSIYFKVSVGSVGRLAVPAASAAELDEPLKELETFRVYLEDMEPAPPFDCPLTT